ncbi:ABC transporter permease [Sphingomonas sp.]|jgi:capsular polysaccharide transport system permease protein|uniref:ABC transporter permease n=1 Tax=Sphingomonas sp. TaxID=28214 RepID=UPI00356389E1
MRSYFNSITLKGRVINALFIRELMARFGHSNVGFLWQVLEPLVLTLGVVASWSLIYGERNHGVRVVPLVLTGYTFLTLWRHMTSRLTNSFRQASGLLFHRVVKPIDILVARGLLESVGTLMAFFAAYIPLALLGLVAPVSDYLVLLGAWTLMCFLTFGVALIITGMTHLSVTLERFVQPVMYLILPLTGVFYMVYWLPPAARQVVQISPLVQACEMYRAGMFGQAIPTFWNPWQILLWGIALNALGWVLVQKAQKHIEME